MYHPKVIDYFKGEMQKVMQWYDEPNPHLTFCSPLNLILRSKKDERYVERFIERTMETEND